MRYLVLALALLCAQPATAARYDHRAANESLRLDLDNPTKIAQRTEAAIEAMLWLAGIKLRQKGFPDVAERLDHEWRMDWKGVIVSYTMAEGLGDHRPLSEWLQLVTVLLETLLGEQLMRFMHLDDIAIVNSAVPVALGMEEFLGEHIDFAEYDVPHFRPLAGVLGFWGTFAACTAATWGAGAIGMACSPAGMLAEVATVKWVAPKLAPLAYRLTWERSSVR